MTLKRRSTLFLPVLAAGLASKVFAGEVKINDDLVVEEDGTLRFDNDATCWRDELQPLIGKKLDDRKSAVRYDLDEFTVIFDKKDADLGDGVVMNIQLNHDWDGITPIQPHLHWFQSEDETPNWVIAYRWHQNGEAKVQDWTQKGVEVIPTVVGGNAFPYTSGTTMLQISGFGSIAPPATPTHVSSMLQLKLMRDNKAQSSVYTASDSYSADVHALSLDIHIKINTMGSRDPFEK